MNPIKQGLTPVTSGHGSLLSKAWLLFAVALGVAGGPALPMAKGAVRTVTNFDDSGPGTLRDTIAASASGDTINFLPGLGVVTIPLTSGQLVINKRLTIVGNGADNLVLDAGSLSRALLITNAVVNISGLTIRGGNSGITDDGGGILAKSGLTVSHCKFVSNMARHGGAICSFVNLVVTLEQVVDQRDQRGVQLYWKDEWAQHFVSRITFAG